MRCYGKHLNEEFEQTELHEVLFVSSKILLRPAVSSLLPQVIFPGTHFSLTLFCVHLRRIISFSLRRGLCRHFQPRPCTNKVDRAIAPSRLTARESVNKPFQVELGRAAVRAWRRYRRSRSTRFAVHVRVNEHSSSSAKHSTWTKKFQRNTWIAVCMRWMMLDCSLLSARCSSDNLQPQW